MNHVLTPAEEASLIAMARANTATEAAALRGVAKQTLKNELTCAYKKLGVRNREEAFKKMGWLRAPANVIMAQAEPAPAFTGEPAPAFP